MPCFRAIHCPHYPLILGLPWLICYNPLVKWKTWEVCFDSSYCHEHCWKPEMVACPMIQAGDPSRGPPPQGTQPPKAIHSLPRNTRIMLTYLRKRMWKSSSHTRIVTAPLIYSLGERSQWSTFMPCQKQNVLHSGITAVKPGLRIHKIVHLTYWAFHLICQEKWEPAPLCKLSSPEPGHHLKRISFIPELLDLLKTNCIFTKLDLWGEYNLAQIRAGDKW